MASVIYLTDTRFGQHAWHHPSARHRCYHYSDALLANRRRSAVMAMDRVSVPMLSGFDHVVFHRPAYNKRFVHAMDCCAKASVKIHADYDDLIFQPDYAQHSPLYVNGKRSLVKVAEQFDMNYKAARYFSNFISSTRFLEARLREVFSGALVTVVPNSLPRLFYPPVKSVQQGFGLTIGYFPGSSGHDEDFKTISAALSEVLNDGVRLLIVGRINSDSYQGLSNVYRAPFADYGDYLDLLSKVDVSIAPLVDNTFNQSKSAVKLIESVSVGTPIVASANLDMHDHSNPLASLVGNSNDWKVALDERLSQSKAQSDKQHMGVKNEIVNSLIERFSVASRLSLLDEHLQCAA